MELRKGPGVNEGGTGISNLSKYTGEKRGLGSFYSRVVGQKMERNLEQKFKLRKENAFKWSNSNTDVGMEMGARWTVMAYKIRKT